MDTIQKKEYLRQWHLKNKERRNLARRERYKNNRQHELEMCSKWSNANREKVRGYQKKSRSRPGFTQYNTARWKKWAVENPDKLKAIRRRKYQKHKWKILGFLKQWRKENPGKIQQYSCKRRALKLGAIVNLGQITEWQQRIKSKPTFVCYWCRNRHPIAVLHFDHIIPLIKGGAHSIENLCASCASCNCSKNKNLITEWYRAGQMVLGL